MTAIEKKSSLVALNFKYGPQTYRLSNYQHILLLSGASGSGKTTVCKSIIASGLCNREINNFHLRLDDRLITFIDLEQPEDIAHEFIDGIKSIADCGTEKLDYRNFSGLYTPEEKNAEFLKAIEDPKCGVVILDNLSNVVTNINDADFSGKFKSTIMAKAKEHNKMIIILAHNNKENQVSGVVGKGVESVASSALNITLYKQNGTSIVETNKCRYGSIPPWSFKVDSKTKKLYNNIYIPFPIY